MTQSTECRGSKQSEKERKKEIEAGGQNDNSQWIGSLAERKVEQIPCSKKEN